MPFGTQMIKSVLLQLGNDLEEASKVCGGTWVDTFRRVIFPLTMPALITVGLVGFISAARDISTVVLLGSGKSRTLSLLMLDFAAGAEFEKATVVAVVIVGLVVGAALFARASVGTWGSENRVQIPSSCARRRVAEIPPSTKPELKKEAIPLTDDNPLERNGRS